MWAVDEEMWAHTTCKRSPRLVCSLSIYPERHVMKKLICIIFTGIAVVAGTLLARTDGLPLTGGVFEWGGKQYHSLLSVSNSRTNPHSLTGHQFLWDGKLYDSLLSVSNLVASPSWAPADRLPLPMDKALEIARAELQKFAPAIKLWKVREIGLSVCIQKIGSEEQIWYYFVRFETRYSLDRPSSEPLAPTRGVVVCVDMAGRPGFIETTDRVPSRKR